MFMEFFLFDRRSAANMNCVKNQINFNPFYGFAEQ